MKHFLLIPTLFFALLLQVNAQRTPGPVEQKVTNNICDCISKLDLESINDKPSAEKAFMNCFSEQANLLVQLAEERNVEFTDHEGMRAIGTDVGKNLLSQNCQGFMQLSMTMANGQPSGPATGITEGRLKRLETKDFNYFVLTDEENKERSFIWLRQFPGSESITADASKLKGKKLKIKWQEMEVYIPSAKNYYNIKEVTGIEVL